MISSIPAELDDLVQKADDLEQKYLTDGDLKILDQAVSAWNTVFKHPARATASPSVQAITLNLCGGIRLRRYWARGRLKDLNVASNCFEQAVRLTPPNSSDLPVVLNNLGNCLSERYARKGKQSDLDHALDRYETALGLMPSDSPDLPALLNNLANSLSDRYARTGNASDLERALSSYEKAVKLTSSDSPDLPNRLTNQWCEF